MNRLLNILEARLSSNHMALISQIRRRNQEYQARVTKRGRPLNTPRERASIGPMLVAFFVFVVIGSGRSKKKGMGRALMSPEHAFFYYGNYS